MARAHWRFSFPVPLLPIGQQRTIKYAELQGFFKDSLGILFRFSASGSCCPTDDWSPEEVEEEEEEEGLGGEVWVGDLAIPLRVRSISFFLVCASFV